MRIGRTERVRMERAHVRAWPALDTAVVDGWLWRCSGGGSQRANSVSTVDFTGADANAAVAAIEARYEARNAPARFQIFEETQPPGLEGMLRERGYREASPTTTMLRRNVPVAPPNDVETREAPWPEWSRVIMGAITPDRRAVNSRIIAAIPGPRAFFGGHRDGGIVSTALCVIAFGCAVIECVATDADARRTGAARAVLGAVLAWAAQQDTDLVGLQVAVGNDAAIRLYQQLGFVAGATNRFWVR